MLISSPSNCAGVSSETGDEESAELERGGVDPNDINLNLNLVL
jgi:hypothetical protein